MATLFISYSHGDEDIRIKLVEHLSNLKRQDLISIWDDRHLEAGEEFTPKIIAEMMKSDIIILLISSKFVRSDYCMDKELPLILDLHSKGEAVAIPVIVNDCIWEDIGINNLVALPKDGKPIKRHGNRDEAYTYICRKVKARAQLINDRPEYVNKYLNKNAPALSIVKSFSFWLISAIFSFVFQVFQQLRILAFNDKKKRKNSKKGEPLILPALLIVGILVGWASLSEPLPRLEQGQIPLYTRENNETYIPLPNLSDTGVENEGLSQGYWNTYKNLNTEQLSWCEALNNTGEKNSSSNLLAELNCSTGMIWREPS